jgi:hypothetical protein
MQKIFIIDLTSNGNTLFFQNTVFPNLEHLEYRHETMDPVQLISSLRAPDKLASLGLSTLLSTESLNHSLRPLPMLQSLVLHRPRSSLRNNGAIQGELLVLLGPPTQGADKMLCPRLQTICSLGLDVGSDQALLALIHARRTMDDVLPLSHLHIAFPSAQQLDIAPRHINADLTVDFRYATKGELKFMAPTPRRMIMVAFKCARPRTNQKTLPKFRDAGADFDQMQARSDPEADWAPMSNRWMAEYEEWGLEEDDEYEDE